MAASLLGTALFAVFTAETRAILWPAIWYQAWFRCSLRGSCGSSGVSLCSALALRVVGLVVRPLIGCPGRSWLTGPAVPPALALLDYLVAGISTADLVDKSGRSSPLAITL